MIDRRAFVAAVTASILAAPLAAETEPGVGGGTSGVGVTISRRFRPSRRDGHDSYHRAKFFVRK